MARPAKIADAALLTKLSDVFREVGYEGASLAVLADAAGLKKASLYHRFPGGKEQMASEVMSRAEEWMTDHVLAALTANEPPETRIRAMIRSLDQFYSGGRQACLLNMMSSPRAERGPFARLIKTVFKAWIDTLAAALRDAGIDEQTALERAERAVTMVQGSLVLARGMGTPRPFQKCLGDLERDLLAPTRAEGRPGRARPGRTSGGRSRETSPR